MTQFAACWRSVPFCSTSSKESDGLRGFLFAVVGVLLRFAPEQGHVLGGVLVGDICGLLVEPLECCRVVVLPDVRKQPFAERDEAFGAIEEFFELVRNAGVPALERWPLAEAALDWRPTRNLRKRTMLHL